MEAVVATNYVNISKDNDVPYAFLIGDSAHAFPPSGGFGMNTGIGDAFNLAHKLATVIKNEGRLRAYQKRKILKSYETERKFIGEITKDIALKNYTKSKTIARMLGFDKDMADIFVTSVDTFLPSFLVDKKKLVRFGLDMGMIFAAESRNLTKLEVIV